MNATLRLSELTFSLRPVQSEVSRVTLSELATTIAAIDDIYRLLLPPLRESEFPRCPPIIMSISMDSPITVKVAILSDLVEAVQKLLDILWKWRRSKIDQKMSETELEAHERASKHEAFLQQVEKYSAVSQAVSQVVKSQTEATMGIYRGSMEVFSTLEAHCERLGYSSDINAIGVAILDNLAEIARRGSIIERLAVTELEIVPQEMKDQIKRLSYPELPVLGAKDSGGALRLNDK